MTMGSRISHGGLIVVCFSVVVAVGDSQEFQEVSQPISWLILAYFSYVYDARAQQKTA